MTIEQLMADKTKKGKEKTEMLSKWLLDGSVPVDELIAFADKSKDPGKATCIEAMEYATKLNSKIADESMFEYVTKALSEKAPRVKWESAKVIANTAHLFPVKLKKVIANLLANSENKGTVVRWATAFALGEVLKLKTIHNKELLPKLEAICNKEEETGVKKKYLDAIRKAMK